MASSVATPGSPSQPAGPTALAFRWPVVLAIAFLMPVALPVPGSLPALVGFLLVIGCAAMAFSVRWLVLFLPVLAALGPYFLEREIAGVNLYGFRLLILALAVFATPLTARTKWWFNPVARAGVLFLSLWAFWGMLSLIWTPDLAGGKVDVMTIIFGLGLTLVLLNMIHTRDHLNVLRFGWVAAFVVVAAMAAWEMATGNRLESFITEKHTTYLDSSLVQATLGTPTGFGGFLLLAMPFLLWSFERSKGPASLLYVGLLGIAAVLILYSGSRASSIGLAAQLGLYFIILERRWFVKIAAVGAVVAALMVGGKLLFDSEMKLAQKWNTAAELDLSDGSIAERLALTANGFYILSETVGRGIGAGGFEERISEGSLLVQRELDRRGRETNAHNFWIEMLSEYGLVPTCALLALFTWIARLAWLASSRAARESDVGAAGRTVLTGFIGYLFYGVTSGSVMGAPSHWMFLASLFVLGAFLYASTRRQASPAISAARP